MATQNLPDHVTLKWEGGPPSLLITTELHTYAFFETCYHSQTYEAYSLKLKCTVWIPLPCKQWSCAFCADTKINQLARRCSAALPTRLLTLTIDPKCWEDPREAFDGTRRKVPELFRILRRRFGEVEYLKVTELTARGWPHYHSLVRSGFLPHSVVRDTWQTLTGATIVDLRKIEDESKTFLSLVKYLTKMHDLKWTKRHVSYSRGFFKDKPHEQRNDLELSEGKVLETHPAKLAYHQFRNSEIVEIAWNVFTLNPSDDLKRQATAAPYPIPQKPSAPPSVPYVPPRRLPDPIDPQPPLFPKNPEGVSTPGA